MRDRQVIGQCRSTYLSQPVSEKCKLEAVRTGSDTILGQGNGQHVWCNTCYAQLRRLQQRLEAGQPPKGTDTDTDRDTDTDTDTDSTQGQQDGQQDSQQTTEQQDSQQDTDTTNTGADDMDDQQQQETEQQQDDTQQPAEQDTEQDTEQETQPQQPDSVEQAVDVILEGAGKETYTQVKDDRLAVTLQAEKYRRELEELQQQPGGFQNPKVTLPDSDITAKLDGLDTVPHEVFYSLLKWASLGENVCLVGPAGSGKTSAARLAADMLGLEFYSTGAVYTKFESVGYTDATGARVDTALSLWASNPDGGVFLFDEMDSSAPKALTPLHECLDNRRLQLPGGQVVELTDKHICIAATNTWLRGADRTYGARSALDGATADRFVLLSTQYDEVFESSIMGVDAPEGAAEQRDKRIKAALRRAENTREDRQKWVDIVRGLRARVAELNLQHIIGMRASRRVVALLEAGYKVTKDDIRVIAGAGLDEGTWGRLSQGVM
jgi:MoxR-like ATPase